MEEAEIPPREAGALVKRFLKYSFFKVAREWRFLGQSQKEEAVSEFLSALDRASGSLGLSFFSLVGTRADVDLLILAESDAIDAFQALISGLLSTRLGRYLEEPYSYLAMSRRSKYLGSHKHPGQEGNSEAGQSDSKYLFVYPFVKQRRWYGLPFVERQRIMAEHFKIGHKYPRIKINTGYSFGLDDQEFVLAFEGDDPAEFLALVEELRGSEASTYTQVETPIFTCFRVSAQNMLELVR